MKIQKLVKTVLGVAGLLALGTFVPTSFGQTTTQEQSAPPAATQPGPKMHRHGEGMFAGLNLTDDQKAQIKKIHEDAKAKADAIRADSSLSDAERHSKLREIRHSAVMESRKVLTPEQREQLKEKRKERRAANAQPQPS